MAQPITAGRSASGAAFVGAALFVALIVLFSLQHSMPLPILLAAFVAVAAHVVLFPVVAVMPAPNWARVFGYGWLAIDIVLNGATLNGIPIETITPFRLGGHILAGIWIVLASWGISGAAEGVGVLLGSLLLVHAFVAPSLPSWAIYPPFVLVPIWLILIGRWLGKATQAETA